jgi:hypothetical protein
MMDTTPEIEAILHDLADLCMQATNGESASSSDRMDSLVNALAMNGWERKSVETEPLSVHLRKRVEDATPTRPTYHAEQLEGVLQKIQKSYDHAVRYRTSVPEDQRPAGKKAQDQASSPVTTLNANSRLG